MSWLDNFLNITRIDRRVSTFLNIKNTYNFEIGFGLREAGSHFVFSFDNINVVDIVFNSAEVQLRCNFVHGDDKTSMVIVYEVC